MPERQYPKDNLPGKLAQFRGKITVSQALLENVGRRVIRNIDFVKYLQGQTAGPGAGLHLDSGRGRLILNILNVNVDAADFHPDHLADGTSYLHLHVPADVANIHVPL